MTKTITTFVHLFLIVFCTALFGTCEATAQTAAESNTLLWKISGKGLERPSYLYGTMHVQDDRAFHFNDSVMVKLRECSAFAMELLPDSLAKVLFRTIFQRDTSNKFRNAIGEEKYNRFATDLQERTGLDLENLNTTQPWLLRSFLDTSDALFHKDKPTFLDGYLYRLARILRKEVFALETPEEQLASFETAPFEQQVREFLDDLSEPPPDRAMLDKFVAAYSSGHLNELEQMVAKNRDSVELHLFLRRNHKMIERLLPLMARHGVFVAVGAAHLPGREGLIDLLQKQGYTVTPVPATFNGPVDIPDDADFNEPWYTFRSDTAAYSIDLPSEPAPYTTSTGQAATTTSMFIYPDFSTGVVYFVSHALLPVIVADTKLATFFDDFGKDMAKEKDGELTLDSSIVYKGLIGREIGILQGNAHLRMRVFLRRNILYMFIVHIDIENVSARDIDRFFSSVQFIPLPEQARGEQLLSSEEGAFSVLMPDAPTMQVTPEETHTTTLYMATDNDTEIAYLMSYMLYLPGQSINHSPFERVAESVAENMEGTITDAQDTVWEGYPMYKFYIESEPDKFAQCRLIVRGSRLYMLGAFSEENELHSEAVDRLLNSLHFTDFKPANWQTYSPPDEAFSILFPAQPVIEHDTATHIVTSYSAQDAYSGSSYIVSVTTYNPYYYTTSEEQFFDDLKEEYIDERDTTYINTRLSISGYPALELEKKSHDGLNVYRIQHVLRHNKHYTLLVHAPREWLHTPTMDKFFTSFALLPTDSTGSLFTKKTQRLSADLLSGDSATQNRAARAVYSSDFYSEDIPFLYEVLRRPSFDDNKDFRSVRTSLLRTLRSTYDSTTIPFLRELYPTLNDTLDLRDFLLQTLASYRTEEALTLMTDLLTTLPRNDSMEHYNPFSFIPTTNATCRVMFPRILSIVESDSYRNHFYGFLVDALDSGIVTTADISGIRQHIQTYGTSTFDKRRAVPEDDSTWQRASLGYELGNVARLLGYFTDSASVSLLHTLAADSDSSLALNALCALEQCGQTTHPALWEGYAVNPVWRNTVYNRLENLHRTERFPEQYRTQEALAEGDLIQFLYDDEDAPSQIQLLQVHEITEGGQQGRYFVYKFCYASRDEGATEPAPWYVGISGPQPLDTKKVTGAGSRTMSYFNTLDEMSIDDHITALLEESSP